MKYSQVTNFKASDLNQMGRGRNKIFKVTIASINNINMYILIKFSTIKELVKLFSKCLISSAKKTVRLCLYPIHFGLSSTIIHFDEYYYEYHRGGEEIKRVGYRRIQISFSSQLDPFLPILEIQKPLLLNNIPRYIHKF